MTVNTTSEQMVNLIGLQQLKIMQLEAALEQAKADAEQAKFAGESDKKQVEQLAEELKSSRNGVVADVTG